MASISMFCNLPDIGSTNGDWMLIYQYTREGGKNKKTHHNGKARTCFILILYLRIESCILNGYPLLEQFDTQLALYCSGDEHSRVRKSKEQKKRAIHPHH